MKNVIISPYSPSLDKKKNPKNFPYWSTIVGYLKKKEYEVIQIGVNGEMEIPGVDEFRKNKPYEELEKMVMECEFWLSVDNFFHHLAAYKGKKGIAIFGPSNPNIFGHDGNVNISKGSNYHTKNQFLMWVQVDYNISAFNKANEVIEEIDKLIKEVQ